MLDPGKLKLVKKHIEAYVISSEEIINNSNGEITSREEIIYPDNSVAKLLNDIFNDNIPLKKIEPVEGGLYCQNVFDSYEQQICECGEKIFDSFEDYYMNCQKKLSNSNYVISCKNCGKTISTYQLKWQKYGYIKLNYQCVNVFLYKYGMGLLTNILDVNRYTVEDIITYDKMLIIESNKKIETTEKILNYNVITRNELFFSANKAIKTCKYLSGIDAIKFIISKIDLKSERDATAMLLNNANEMDDSEIKKFEWKLAILNFLIDSNKKLEWMLIDVIPIVSPFLRTKEIYDLYKKIINLNKVIKKHLEQKTPDLFAKSYKVQLQGLVDDLISKTWPWYSNKLFTNMDSIVYDVAICKYNDNLKQFFYEGEPLINEEWKIIENNDIVVPIAFKKMISFELNDSKDSIMHIKYNK